MDINVDEKGTPKTRVMLWFGIYLFNQIQIEIFYLVNRFLQFERYRKKMVYFGKQLKKAKYQSSQKLSKTLFGNSISKPNVLARYVGRLITDQNQQMNKTTQETRPWKLLKNKQ